MPANGSRPAPPHVRPSGRAAAPLVRRAAPTATAARPGLRKTHDPEAALARELSRIIEEKVRRVAHALHDEAGQLLACVYLRLAALAADLPPRHHRALDELRALLDVVDDELRRLAHELRPSVLDHLGLVPACESLGANVAARAGLRVRVEGSTGGRLAPDLETALYRVVQEAVNNVVRHARAANVTIRFTREGAMLSGAVIDDGCGFDVEAAAKRPGVPGIGLAGMRERLLGVNGSATVASAPGKGTSIRFRVPVGA